MQATGELHIVAQLLFLLLGTLRYTLLSTSALKLHFQINVL
jgi:hypothetical protein